MSEVQSRGSNTRGRGGFRGGRGGYRGSRGAKSHGKVEEQENIPPLEDQGEVGELKAKYAGKLPLLREVCEGWSDEDLVFALQETNGDEAAALDRITSGTISQWGEVKKKQPKAKESSTSAIEGGNRGRGRGGFDARGRGRGAERVARAGRGGRTAPQANGTKHSDKATKTTDEVWGESSSVANGEPPSPEDWANDPGKDKLESLETEHAKPAAAAAPGGKPGGWAGLFAKAPAAPMSKKETPRYQAPDSQAVPAIISTTEPEESLQIPAPEETTFDSLPVPPAIEPLVVDDGPSELPSAPHSDVAPSDLAPPGDELTEKNVNKLPDVSHPIATATAASTGASTQDPLNPALPPASAIRPGMSGHAASAFRATASSGRSTSYTRKIMEQQEAVVMPGNHAVDRAAVQFGKMGLNGDDLEADEEREEPETRTQLPDDSPAAPRASLPPSMPESQAAAQPVEEQTTESQAQRPAPGLPSVSAHPQQPSPQHSAGYPDQYRYAQGQKPYDPFSQQPQHPQPAAEPFSNQIPGQSQGHPNATQQEYAQYYGREYSHYYGGYGQGQENQRSGSAFGTSAQDAQAQYATAGPRGYSQQDVTTSGNNTPNPPVASHQAQQSSQHMQQGPGAHGAYPYGAYGSGYGSGYPQYGAYNSHRYGANRPMFDDARRQQDDYYSSQYGYSHNQGYNSSYKSNMYAAPQHQYSHDYSSSPANAGYGGREGSYGRTGSTQPSEAQQSGSSGAAFGGSMPDPFGRTSSGFGQSQHGSHGGSEDPAKPTGPSPSLQGNRPASAANTVPGHQQGGLPHPQSGQQAFGGYPQYGGFGNQNTHNAGYGAYGSNSAFGGYGGYGRGWAGNYGSGQH